jgi:hypothetical protein
MMAESQSDDSISAASPIVLSDVCPAALAYQTWTYEPNSGGVSTITLAESKAAPVDFIQLLRSR